MDENPYKAPVEATATRLPRKRIWIGVGLLLVAAILALTKATQENPRYWDEVERRMKTGMTWDEATESLDEELAKRGTGSD
jgi:hypothetical protein